jgi:F-type H+-transporting ATPase subunit b
MDALNSLGLNFGTLLVQIFGFFLMLIVLRAWVYTPLLGMLEKRRLTINQGIEDAHVAAEARENAEEKAKKIIDEAQAKAAEIVHEATQRAEDMGREIESEAEEQAAKARQDALNEVESEREAMLVDARGQVAALAMAAAQKLIGESLDENRQRALIDEFFSGVRGDKVVIEAGVEGDAVVTSALPLTDKEKAAISKSLKGKVNYKVNPKILGGLVIRVGDKVLDASVAGQLESLRQNLN